MRLVRSLLQIEAIVEAADAFEEEDAVAVVVEEAVEVGAFMMRKVAIVTRKQESILESFRETRTTLVRNAVGTQRVSLHIMTNRRSRRQPSTCPSPPIQELHQ